MPPRRSPLPLTLGAVFTRSEALLAGVTPARLRASDLERPFRNVYRRVDRSLPPGVRRTPVSGFEEDQTHSPAHPDAWWRRSLLRNAMAFTKIMSCNVFFSLRTAAVIHELPVPPPANHRDRAPIIEIAKFAPGFPSAPRGVAASTLRPGSAAVTTVNGLRTISVASAWALTATSLSVRDAVAVGDAALHRSRIPGTQRLDRQPRTTPLELQAAVDRLPNRDTRRRLNRLLGMLAPHAASPPESHLRVLLREWRLPDFVLDHDVFDDTGSLLGASEIAFPQFRLAVEYEGDHHRTDQRQWNRDIAKYQAYSAAGWRVVRVTADLLYRQPEALRLQICTALLSCGWHP